jgi:hypothetical protein
MVNVGVDWANKDLVLAGRAYVCVWVNGFRVYYEFLPTGLSNGDIVSLWVVGIEVPLGLEFRMAVSCRGWVDVLSVLLRLYMGYHKWGSDYITL